MPRITLSKPTIDHLLNDPKLREWRATGADGRQPRLRYFRRYYSTAPDGTVTEHGDGFSLYTIDLRDPRETNGLVIRRVAVVHGLDILVVAQEAIMSNDFTIGLTARRGFTYEPQASA